VDYTELSYRELKTECAKRGLGGGGKGIELLAKLNRDDSGEPSLAGPEVATPDNDPDPTNPNYLKDGRWRRRPKGWLNW
jgi:hypothetical protein